MKIFDMLCFIFTILVLSCAVHEMVHVVQADWDIQEICVAGYLKTDKTLNSAFGWVRPNKPGNYDEVLPYTLQTLFLIIAAGFYIWRDIKQKVYI